MIKSKTTHLKMLRFGSTIVIVGSSSNSNFLSSFFNRPPKLTCTSALMTDASAAVTHSIIEAFCLGKK